MALLNPVAIPFLPQARKLDQACYHVSGRVPIDIFGHDWNISRILLDSGASANFVSDKVATMLQLDRYGCPPRNFSIGDGTLMNVTSFVTFPLYIGGVFRGSVKAYVKPTRDGEMHMVLGMPGWDAFLIGIERTSELVRETIATVAQHVEGGPEERYVVPDVGNVAMEVSMVSSIPLGARALRGGSWKLGDIASIWSSLELLRSSCRRMRSTTWRGRRLFLMSL